MKQRVLNPKLVIVIAAVILTGFVLAYLTLQQATVLRVTVELSDPDSRFSDDWPVYIYAVTPGSRLPLSSYATRLSKLPLSVELTEEMYLLPEHTLADKDKVQVLAKVSSSGDPHQPGPEDVSAASDILDLTQHRQRRVSLQLNSSP